MSDTKTQILDAAEQLFAEKGFAATSLRTITARAGVNLAAVNYHFGSKDALIDAVFARHMQPLHAERMAMLDTFEQAGALTVENILRAFIQPALRICREERRGPVVVKLMGRLHIEPSDALLTMFIKHIEGTVARFLQVLCQALPELPPDDVFYRFFFSVGAFAHSINHARTIELLRGRTAGAGGDVETMLARLIPFLAAGMRAPASGLHTPSREPRP